ncbi:YbaB/EbfC family nucleoid-associated protein [Candidatus Parcubacteria bacterium]|nr:YbaB/EbfC family nucleoid-associated protein [Patescibacteria group bacterium]MBU4309170.1 YbaB/EbfC family nucleoid-associated protein [Patescibacteria group bacterium]MBU4432693.1 YbaB/EbfC family nucleoid-associated protein [Patescibacteria group bacterium]MBU4577531.1 YbaB/EbfC family nucleoid-associated protein [Patescibacteria group bacterium]MCG2697218.1 YbaB/EbfC family nucleoid-associated protein [Candidatus Parcubacteria bacterium]
MFNKLKQIKDLRDQAKVMQSALSGESITVDRKGLTLVMNGNMEITSVKINEEITKEKLEEIIKDNTNNAIKQIQKVMAKKMQEMGGFPGLS